jgi:hypothetical protein
VVVVIPTIDHIQDGAAKVISQYRNKPKFLLRLACYLNQIQHIEDAIFALRAAFNPDTATGFRLDWIGRKVGQARLGSDSTLRLLAKARIRVNRSQGKTSDLAAVGNLLLSLGWTYDEWGTTIQIYTADDLTPLMIETVQDLLQATAPGGVPVFLLQTAGSPAFEFAVEGSDLALSGGFDTEAGDTNAGIWSTVQ